MTEPRVEAGDRALAFLESEAFYDAMQTYRHMSVGRQAEVVEAFEAVKKLIQSTMNAQERELRSTLEMVVRCSIDGESQDCRICEADFDHRHTEDCPILEAERLLAERGEGR